MRHFIISLLIIELIIWGAIIINGNFALNIMIGFSLLGLGVSAIETYIWNEIVV